MINRISSTTMFNQSVSLMLGKQAKLSQLELQLATGKKLVSAKDDPVNAGTAVNLDRSVAELARFELNGNTVQNRLGLQENALAQAGEMMSRIVELTVQANNPALSGEDKKTIAAELKSIHAGLLSLANSTDGNGRFLFGGASDDSSPFSIANGTVTYTGDQTQKQVEVAPQTFVADALPGSEIFMRIRTGDGIVDGAAAAGNTGTGVLTDLSRDANGAWSGEGYSVRFTGTDTYEVLDSTGTAIQTGTFKASEDISFQGLRIHVEGEPAAGDTFTIAAAGTRDIFSTITGLVSALEMDLGTPAAVAAQQNALQSGIRDVARASEKMIDSRAAGGAQLMALDNAAALREANGVTLKTTLSNMRDLDYAEAISQYQLENAALQAAQTIFSQMQSMSLFNMIR